MKLSQLLKAWDILHVMDVGEVGFCDLDNALTEAGVIIENDCSPCQPVLQQADSADGEGAPVLEGVDYLVNQVDAETISLTRR